LANRPRLCNTTTQTRTLLFPRPVRNERGEGQGEGLVFASYVVNLSPWTQKRMPAGSDADKPKKKKNYGLPCVPGDSPGLNSDVNIGRKSTCWISTVTLGGSPWNWMDFNTGCHTKYAMTRNGRSGWPNRALRNYDFGTTNGAKIPKASCLRSETHCSAEPVA